MAKTICLSAGHQPGVDPGAVYGNMKEADLTVKIVRKASEIIRKHGVGCLEVPDNLDLGATIQWINARTAQIDVTVEVHINAANGGTGIEAYHFHDTSAGQNDSEKLSQFLVDAVAVETGLPNRGIKDEATTRFKRLGFIHDTNPVASLIECGFIDNPIDRQLMTGDMGLEKFAKGVARGALGYLGIAWKPEILYPPAPPIVSEQPTDAVTVKEIKRWFEDRVKEILHEIESINKRILELETRTIENGSRMTELVKRLEAMRKALE